MGLIMNLSRESENKGDDNLADDYRDGSSSCFSRDEEDNIVWCSSSDEGSLWTVPEDRPVRPPLHLVLHSDEDVERMMRELRNRLHPTAIENESDNQLADDYRGDSIPYSSSDEEDNIVWRSSSDEGSLLNVPDDRPRMLRELRNRVHPTASVADVSPLVTLCCEIVDLETAMEGLYGDKPEYCSYLMHCFKYLPERQDELDDDSVVLTMRRVFNTIALLEERYGSVLSEQSQDVLRHYTGIV